MPRIWSHALSYLFIRKKNAQSLKIPKVGYLKLREPGGSKNSEQLRKLLLSTKSNFEKKTDLLIYLSARSENFHKKIKPNLKKK